MTYKEKMQEIMQRTGWRQARCALKCGRYKSEISRLLNGKEPQSKTFKLRIDDLFEEVRSGMWDKENTAS